VDLCGKYFAHKGAVCVCLSKSRKHLWPLIRNAMGFLLLCFRLFPIFIVSKVIAHNNALHQACPYNRGLRN
jgi:hypothetical protein